MAEMNNISVGGLIDVTDIRPPYRHYDECPDSPTFGMPIGVKRHGTMTLTGKFLPNEPTLYESLFKSFNDNKPIDIVWRGVKFKAVVISLTAGTSVPGSFYSEVKAELRIVEADVTKEEKKVAPKKVRFYIGKRDVCEGTDFQQWGKGSLPEAIEQAKALAEKTDEPYYIVKVIKVVRRKKPPVTVEDVK